MTREEIKRTLAIFGSLLTGWMAYLIIAADKFDGKSLIVHAFITMMMVMTMIIIATSKEAKYDRK